MYRSAPMARPRGGVPTHSGDNVVKLHQVPRWSDAEHHSLAVDDSRDRSCPHRHFLDPLTAPSRPETGSIGSLSRFPVDHGINSKIYLWRGQPWTLDVDAVVNSTNEALDEAHSSPGLHAAAGPDLADECRMMGGCRTGMAKITNAYDLPARRVIHTVGPTYAAKYHTAAENALGHCYRSCLELLIENGFQRLLPLYFPRDKHEEEVAVSKLPVDIGDENGDTVIDERKIRIKTLPAVSAAIPRSSSPASDLPVSDIGCTQRRPLEGPIIEVTSHEELVAVMILVMHLLQNRLEDLHETAKDWKI